ncbi:phosphoenolpyruvate carboxykinase (ATP) [Zunongwangia sp. HRR-M8]|uniref:phosphoenolpyruvate carboxykinase (ATP) n=1 Tax=Zunongwangia sp. HRR-M8 TaxID=3015170 RepID=UPI0022DD2D3A|nr:phosphoenolpyruvate carboxykinase (ATP) [Zunongwangia sp. HRR-M8]WBL22103.1 phosphoenolpyruvate carboxykinase (ATP) [Zunongwangia sp. HRR-M8]
MDLKGIITKTISLNRYGIENSKANYQLSPEELQQITIENQQGEETRNGVLAIKTGKFTGRSPKDRFIVQDEVTKDRVWWGDINIPFDASKFDKLYDKVASYLSGKEVFVRDAYACADKGYKLNIRVINEYPWSNMFSYNMFLRPTEAELQNFKEDWVILNAPGFKANPEEDGTRQPNFAILNFSKKIALIGGTGYTGEIKKGIFSALNLILPVDRNTLPMHCSANVGEEGDTAIFFGLSGTGKTTLSADPKRKLIGDDEHGWSPDDKIFNFEGGCYAKVINLSKENEADIYNAIKPGAILENIVFKNGEVDYTDTSITQNTRVSYPIDHIHNIQQPSIGENPKNIFFLTADAFGVLPPISKLSPGQAAYHFISGYTAKVAGTEEGVHEPLPSFSACFGAPFMPLHPTKYAEMLSLKMKKAKVNVWLVNTGWTGGPYGTGKRMKLGYTRAMIDAALAGNFEEITFEKEEYFGLKIPKYCPNVPSNILNPKKTWNDQEAYDAKAQYLADSFIKNFKKFEEYADYEILSGAPVNYECNF